MLRNEEEEVGSLGPVVVLMNGQLISRTGETPTGSAAKSATNLINPE